MRLRGFGYSETQPSPLAEVAIGSRILMLPDQREALRQLRDLVQPFVADPLVNEVALKAVGPCPSRDEFCELEALFHCVKYGNPDILGFERGLKYVADPNWADKFTSPRKIIENLRSGINGGDCDDHAGLMCALGGSIGFTMGLMAYGPAGTDGYSHVFAVAKIPKRLDDPVQMVGLDTTVSRSTVGWLPPGIYPEQTANILVAWLQ